MGSNDFILTSSALPEESGIIGHWFLSFHIYIWKCVVGVGLYYVLCSSSGGGIESNVPSLHQNHLMACTCMGSGIYHGPQQLQDWGTFRMAVPSVLGALWKIGQKECVPPITATCQDLSLTLVPFWTWCQCGPQNSSPSSTTGNPACVMCPRFFLCTY